MEKKRAHYLLVDVKALAADNKVRATKTALSGAAALGFNFHEMIDLVRTLEPADFYKSMTTHNDHTVWQDVYHLRTTKGDVYMKLTVINDVLIISFKEL